MSSRFLIAEVVLAMEFLHDNNILYRDLKPENILVDAHGHLRLTDFGLCINGFSPSEKIHDYAGSPEYMSPEILQGKGYNYSVDFYTLGVLLYEMLVGLPPHYNVDRQQMYSDKVSKEPDIPRVLSGEIKNLLTGLLNRNPGLRIGARRGMAEVKEHAFFKDIDWEALKMKMP